MTAQNENPREPQPDRQLENILKTVRSIDHNVEQILERLSDYFDDSPTESTWTKDYDPDLADY